MTIRCKYLILAWSAALASAAGEPVAITVPAIAFSAQGGGEVTCTEARKPSADFGEEYLHFWFTPGHWLEWTIEDAAAGDYTLSLRYAAKQGAVRAIALNGAAPETLPRVQLPRTERWNVGSTFVAPGKIRLSPGRNTLRMTCSDGVSLVLGTITLASEDAGRRFILPAARFTGEGGGYVQLLAPPAHGFVRKFASRDHWLEWTVVAPVDAEYSLTLHYATADPENVTQVRMNDRDVPGMESVTVPTTGDDNHWSRCRLPGILRLRAGVNVLRLTRKNGDLALSALVLDAPPAPPAPPPPAFDYTPVPRVSVPPAPLGPPPAPGSDAGALAVGQTVLLGGRRVTVRALDALPYVSNRFSRRFRFENFDNPLLRKFREMYRLDDAVAAGRDEFEKQMLLMEYIFNSWDFGHAKERYNLKDPFEIMEFARREHKFQCMHSGAVLQTAFNSMGWVARPMAIPQHTFNEVWSNQHARWILFDATSNYVPMREGRPLNTYELRQALLVDEGRDTFSVRMRNGQWVREPKSVEYGRRLLFIAFIPNTDNLVSNLDYEKMFIIRDRFSEGRTWHTRDNPEDPFTEPYFPINQAALTLRPDGDRLLVSLGTLTPNFKEFRVRQDEGPWEPLEGTTFRWPLRTGSNRLEAVSVNRFDVSGPVSSVQVDVSE